MKKIDVPWLSQLDAKSTSPMDCGQACVLMLAKYWGYASPDLTVDELYKRAPAPGGTVYSDLQRLAAGIRYTAEGRDFVLSAGPNPTPDILRGYIEQGYPPILLVWYEGLGIPRPDLTGGARAVGLHWIVVVGYDDDVFYFHDPLYKPSQRDGQGGANIPIASATLMGALRGVNLHHWRAVELPVALGQTRKTPHTVGLHIVQGSRTGYGNFLTALKAAGKPCAVVKAVDDGAPLAEARAAGALTIYRYYGGLDTPAGNWTGNPVEVANQWMQRLMPRWREISADVYEVLNEPKCDAPEKWDFLNKLMMACIDIAEVNGFRLACYGFAPGVPEVDELARLVPSLKRARQGGHIWTTHEYGLPSSMIESALHVTLRYRTFYHEVLEPNEIDDLPLVISEAAPNGGHDWGGPEFFMEQVEWYTRETSKDPYVLGVCWYTLGNWASANFEQALPAMVNVATEG